MDAARRHAARCHVGPASPLAARARLGARPRPARDHVRVRLPAASTGSATSRRSSRSPRWRPGGTSERRWRAAACCLSLLTSSAIIVHLWHGQTEAHFHFFVVVTLCALYEEWLPYGLAFLYVVLHHTVMGVLTPTTVYDARRQPAPLGRRARRLHPRAGRRQHDHLAAQRGRPRRGAAGERRVPLRVRRRPDRHGAHDPRRAHRARERHVPHRHRPRGRGPGRQAADRLRLAPASGRRRGDVHARRRLHRLGAVAPVRRPRRRRRARRRSSRTCSTSRSARRSSPSSTTRRTTTS